MKCNSQCEIQSEEWTPYPIGNRWKGRIQMKALIVLMIDTSCRRRNTCPRVTFARTGEVFSRVIEVRFTRRGQLMMTTMDAAGVYVERGKLVSSILDTWLLVRFFTGLTQLMSIYLSIYLSIYARTSLPRCMLFDVCHLLYNMCLFSYL